MFLLVVRLLLSAATVAGGSDMRPGRRGPRISEPIAEPVRPIGVGRESEGLRRFDEYAADQRRYWNALREGGALAPGQEGEIIRAEVLRLSGCDDEGRA